MCDPPHDGESHYKDTKNKAIKNTDLLLFFDYFSVYAACPDLCKERTIHMASIARRFVSVNVRQMFSLMGL